MMMSSWSQCGYHNLQLLRDDAIRKIKGDIIMTHDDINMESVNTSIVFHQMVIIKRGVSDNSIVTSDDIMASVKVSWQKEDNRWHHYDPL